MYNLLNHNRIIKRCAWLTSMSARLIRPNAGLIRKAKPMPRRSWIRKTWKSVRRKNKSISLRVNFKMLKTR